MGAGGSGRRWASAGIRRVAPSEKWPKAARTEVTEGLYVIKFTVAQCRALLDPEVNARMSDADVERVRDEMYVYALAAFSGTQNTKAQKVKEGREKC